MDIGICSYSFHRSLRAGEQDIFKFITDCKELGCTILDPWCGHFTLLREGDQRCRESDDPIAAGKLTDEEKAYLDKVIEAARAVDMPFGCIAVDGAHIYDDDENEMKIRRGIAKRWIDISHYLKARYARIDAGGPEDMPDEVLAVIIEGYNDIIAYAKTGGLEIITENHFGPTKHPEHVVTLLEKIDGLGFLFDTNNWAEGKQVKAWEMTAKYATATHVKTFSFDENGEDPSVDLPYAFKLLNESGFKGAYSVESVPRDGDERGACEKTIAMIKKYAAA